MNGYAVPLGRRWMRAFLGWAGRVIFHLLARVEVEGLENIPTSGPYVMAFNHVSIFDPPFVIAFWPVHPEILGAVDIWSRPGQDILARLYEAIPIRRGEVDRDAMGRTLAVLRAGLPLMVSPEGGRSHRPGLRRGKAGVVYLIERTQAPVIPVGVIGTTDDFFKRAMRGEKPLLHMQIGAPFLLPEIDDPSVAPKDIRQRKVDFIMCKMAALLPADYQGVYGHPAQKCAPPAAA
jgi:1-acyl-sn-glycerol-3-phosphate acyltransferase